MTLASDTAGILSRSGRLGREYFRVFLGAGCLLFAMVPYIRETVSVLVATSRPQTYRWSDGIAESYTTCRLGWRFLLTFGLGLYCHWHLLVSGVHALCMSILVFTIE